MSNVVEFATLEEFQKWFKGRLAAAKTWEADDIRSYMVRNFTPDMALWVWDIYNTRNRDHRPKWVKKLIRIIKEGKWLVHSQGISMSNLDRLNNGQHRLEAIADSGENVTLYFSFNEADGAFPALDSGEKRNVGDLAKQHGIVGAKKMSAAVKIIMTLAAGKKTTQGSVGPQDVLEWLLAHPTMVAVNPAAQEITSKINGRHSGILAALYLIRRTNPGPSVASFTEFTEKLANGAGMNEGHPILTLRNGLIQRKYDVPEKADGAQGVLTAAAIINGWNRWIAGRTTTRASTFIWNPADEAFPVPLNAFHATKMAA